MTPTIRSIATAAVLAVGLSACLGDDAADLTFSPEEPVTVTLLSHDSFVMPDEIVADLAAQGIELELLPGGDAGTVVNQAILSAGDPQADVLFGIDSTLLTRGLEADLFHPYESPALAQIDDALELDAGEFRVTPIDVSDVCINFDREAYGEDLPVPTTLDDLADPAYAGQLVVENPASSSPGLAFLLRTVAEYGEDGWLDYWQRLVDNDVEITAGWEDAYYGVFSGGSGEGDRPLVVSYSTSPPAEVIFGPDPEADESPIGTVLDSCYRQIEFAGILAGSEVVAAAEVVIDTLAGVDFQSSVPLNMFVEPARTDVELPEAFVKFAERPDSPSELDPDVITENRERWIQEWTELVLGQ